MDIIGTSSVTGDIAEWLAEADILLCWLISSVLNINTHG